MTAIRILADDLTGALDTAAAFTGDIPVFIDHPPARGDSFWGAPVSVLATPTRDIPVEQLPDYLEPTLAWLRSGDIAYKKVDSLLRGNTFDEIAYLLRKGEFPSAVFAPAFPAQGRYTFDNRQWVAKPGGEINAVSKPLGEAFGALGCPAKRTPDLQGNGTAVWIPEVRDDATLDRIAARSNDEHHRAGLWCGSAGLAHAIARQIGMAPDTHAQPPADAPSGLTALISASFQPSLYAQWDLLKNEIPTQALAERAQHDEIAHVIELAKAGATDARFDLSPRRDMTQEESLALLHRNIQHIVSGLPKPRQLMIVGGDTLLDICRTTGAQALLAGASIRPGWGRATLVGGCWNGVCCHSRSGAFGSPDDLVQMMRRLTDRIDTTKGK